MMSALLLRHLFESSVVCALLGLCAESLRRQRAAVRHALWLGGVSKFALPTVILTATGARIALAAPAAAWFVKMAGELYALLVRLFGTWPIDINVWNVTPLFFGFIVVWATGFVWMLSVWCVRLRQSCQGFEAAMAKDQAALEGAVAKLRFTASVKLRICPAATEPALVGFWRPMIVIPQGLSQRLTPSEFEAVLMHELAHAQRRDNLTGAFVQVVVCTFWFHPLLWFAQSRVMAERERACDEAVLQYGTPPDTYVAGIAKVCRYCVLENVAGVSRVGGWGLKDRFNHILSCEKSQPVPYMLRVLLTVLIAFLTGLPVAGGYCEQCGTIARTSAPPDKVMRLNRP